MKKLYSVKSVRLAEERLIDNGETVISLMKRAGDGLFQKLKNAPYNEVYIFVGKGNNGGDGFALACDLLSTDKRVSVVKAGGGVSAASSFFKEKYVAGGGKILDFAEGLNISGALIVDCIFGVGFHGEVTGEEKRAIDFINAVKRNNNYVVSVDIPSGLNGDCGLFSTAVEADETLAIGCLKSGLILNAAKDCVGRLDVVDIGLEVDNATAYYPEAQDLAPVLKKRKNFSHKNDYGTVGVFGGSLPYGGAVKLSNTSLCALYAGAGISRLIVPKCISGAVSPFLLESTLSAVRSDDNGVVFDKGSIDEALKGLDALSVGMGLTNTDETYKTIEYILKNVDIKLCVDADGLNALSKNVALLDEKRTYKTVITPHVGEFCRLSGLNKESVLADPVGCAKAFAAKHNVILLLKGTATVVTDGTITYVTDRGVAGMATAGSGDVLSGVIAGLLGYNEPSALTVAAAAFIVGYAAEVASRKICDVAYTASDTVRHIQSAVTEIFDTINQ